MLNFDKKENDKVFFDIVEGTDFRDDSEKTLESLEEFKDQILRSLNLKIEKLPLLSPGDDQVYRRICNRLSWAMNGESKAIDKLNYDDHVISYGDITFMMESGGLKETCVLPGDFIIEGDVDVLEVTTVPDLSTARQAMKEYPVDIKPVPMTPLGLAIVLKHVTLLCPDGSLVPLENNHKISIPVDYEHLPLKRVISAE